MTKSKFSTQDSGTWLLPGTQAASCSRGALSQCACVLGCPPKARWSWNFLSHTGFLHPQAAPRTGTEQQGPWGFRSHAEHLAALRGAHLAWEARPSTAVFTSAVSALFPVFELPSLPGEGWPHCHYHRESLGFSPSSDVASSQDHVLRGSVTGSCFPSSLSVFQALVWAYSPTKLTSSNVFSLFSYFILCFLCRVAFKNQHLKISWWGNVLNLEQILSF